MPSVYLLGGELPGGKDHLLLQEHNKGKGEGGSQVSKEAPQGHEFWQNASLCSSQERGYQRTHLPREQFILLCCFLIHLRMQ